jgi:hypothetical protein
MSANRNGEFTIITHVRKSFRDSNRVSEQDATTAIYRSMKQPAMRKEFLFHACSLPPSESPAFLRSVFAVNF